MRRGGGGGHTHIFANVSNSGKIRVEFGRDLTCRNISSGATCKILSSPTPMIIGYRRIYKFGRTGTPPPPRPPLSEIFRAGGDSDMDS